MERSFAAEVKQLALGEGQILRGEGILAITKGLLQSGVSYVDGYPEAPVSHPVRGAVTWKSIVGTTVAADALSNRERRQTLLTQEQGSDS